MNEQALRFRLGLFVLAALFLLRGLEWREIAALYRG